VADEEQEQQAEEAEQTPEEATPPVEAEASETPAEPDPEAPPEEPGPPVPEPTSPEPTPEPAPEPIEVAEGEPEAQAEAGEEAPEESGDTGAEEEAAAPPAAASAKKKRKRVPRSERRQRLKTRERATERKPISRQPKPEGERGRRQERRGVVVSAGMDKTIVVRVDVVKAHPKYKKVVRRSQRFHAHDEQNQAKAGDVVRIVETRPLSKTKNWRLAEIVEVAQ
jgi:small subunit ribosomal protein S17